MLRAVARFFAWCEDHHIALNKVEPILVAAYIGQHPGSVPTVEQHLAAIRMLFDYLVIGQVVPFNSAAAVRGPKHVVERGKTPVLKAEQARMLLDSISLKTIVGPRDRAILGVMCYTFARVGAVGAMRVEDYYENGKRGWFPLARKGRQAPRGARPPQCRGVHGRLPGGGRDRWREKDSPVPIREQVPEAHRESFEPQ